MVKIIQSIDKMDKQPLELSDLTEDDAESVQTNQLEPPIKRSNKRLLVMGSVIAGLIAVVVVGFFLTQRENISPVEQTPSPTSTPTASSTASPEVSFSRSEWSLEVLNGTGVTGAAKKLADKLAELGYKIIKTGNADRSDYDKNQLFVSKEMTDKKDLLLQDLKKDISLASVSGELKDSTASARIIIGKE